MIRNGNKLVKIVLNSRCYSHLTANHNVASLNQQLKTNGIHTTLANQTFFERDKKSGYRTSIPVTKKKLILDGLKELKSEIKLWKEEMREKFESDPIVVFRPGEIDVVYKFSKPEDLGNWVVATDKDHNEGYSTAKFEISSAGYGLFHGNLDSKVPKDGKIFRAGYAGLRSLRVRVSDNFIISSSSS